MHICDKAQYKEANWMERLRLKFHLMLCNNCPIQSQKNEELTALCKKANLKTLSIEDKLALKKMLKNNI